MGLRSSSLAKKNDDTLTWVLHRRDLCQQVPDQKPNETKSYGGSTSSEYRGRRHNNHVQRKRRNHVHSNILDYGKPEQTYGYGISDLDDFLSKSSIGRPGNIPMVLCTGCLLYQTQLDDHYQTEVALPLGMVVNAVFKNEQWLYVQTPHAEEGYIPYGSCLPLGIVPPPDAARAPCWETQSDVFPRPVGDRRRRGRGHRGGRVGGFGTGVGGGGGADDYDEDDQDNDDDDDRDVATLLFRRRHCGRGQSSPPPPLRRPTAATRSVTGYGYL
ncbi:uncharacterized protein LOC100160815 [Acyrthosiphon pisum]|uniref:SH3 domain-containing protein n=1 Tax=Acyrthosiphon pisum TaxID=7029 RepID=A0A8R1VY98_ACYPI|nr:uncharacterized protein LOC100160815 [Acyrthosiphon pisum]|eukprot:XP_001942744.1 PREDICTED: uncharacterized protein LOC100160815 [Acyrthosiphon pisum]